jgi:hypothetical protein
MADSASFGHVGEEVVDGGTAVRLAAEAVRAAYGNWERNLPGALDLLAYHRWEAFGLKDSEPSDYSREILWLHSNVRRSLSVQVLHNKDPKTHTTTNGENRVVLLM